MEQLEQVIPKGIPLANQEIILIQVPIDYDTAELTKMASLQPREIEQTPNTRIVLESLPPSMEANMINQLFPLIYDSTKKEWTASKKALMKRGLRGS